MLPCVRDARCIECGKLSTCALHCCANKRIARTIHHCAAGVPGQRTDGGWDRLFIALHSKIQTWPYYGIMYIYIYMWHSNINSGHGTHTHMHT